jgi:hypothetical protein
VCKAAFADLTNLDSQLPASLSRIHKDLLRFFLILIGIRNARDAITFRQTLSVLKKLNKLFIGMLRLSERKGILLVFGQAL